MKIPIRFFLASVLLLALLAACSAQPTPTSAPTSASTQAAYPSVSETKPTDSGYPLPKASENIQVVPTTQPGSGVVIGKLMLKGKPLVNNAIGLGQVLKSDSGAELATAFDRIASPQTSTGPDGSFIFVNVPPGRYGLIFTETPETYLLLKPGLEEAILVAVDADKTSDLGTFDFASLPGTE
jgi:hypothetical protein